MREFVTWMHDGVELTQLSAPSKRETLIEYAKHYNLRTFVETGTCEGETLNHLLPHFDKLYSIEIDLRRYASACNRFVGNPNIFLWHGNSGKILPKILPLIEEPALYWLDAHTDAPPNGLGPDNPLMEELRAIIIQKKQGIVLVDDMDFGKSRELIDGILRIEL